MTEYSDWVIFDGCVWCPVCNEPIPAADATIGTATRLASRHECTGVWMGWTKEGAE